MYRSTVVFLCIIGVVVGRYPSFYNSKRFSGYPRIEPEVPCTANGGICVLASDCPAGKLAPISGLCPVQQKKGVECCYSVGESETRCRENGGECMPRTARCPDSLMFPATDCTDNQKCCVLV